MEERGGGGEGTETSLLWCFRQKPAVANNAFTGQEGTLGEGGRGEQCIYLGGLSETGPLPPSTFSASRGEGESLRDVVVWPSDAKMASGHRRGHAHI